MTFILTQSGIKGLMRKGEVRKGICPAKWKLEFIDGVKVFKGDVVNKGIFFEYMTGIDPYAEIRNLPRSRRDGSKLTTETRLEEQALVFKKICYEKGIIISRSSTQLIIRCPWDETGYKCPNCKHENIDVFNIFEERPEYIYAIEAVCKNCGIIGDANDFAKVVLQGKVDILSPFKKKMKTEEGIITIQVPLGFIDVKVTQDVTSDYEKNEYSWGKPSNMDLYQKDMYPYIFAQNTLKELPFAYAVFDHKKDPEHRWMNAIVDATTRAEFLETVRKTLEHIKWQYGDGWIPVGSKKECEYCPLGSTDYGDGSCKFFDDKTEIEI